MQTCTFYFLSDCYLFMYNLKYKYLILLPLQFNLCNTKKKRDLMKAMTLYVTKLFVYFTLNDISEVTLFCKSWFVLV